MKSVLTLIVFLSLGTLFLSCSSRGTTTSSGTAAAEQTYQCPSCKQMIRYQYHPIKPWIVTGKEVVHTCPTCNRQWSGNIAANTTCPECNKKECVCPDCQMKS
jgi:hypothetical protein